MRAFCLFLIIHSISIFGISQSPVQLLNSIHLKFQQVRQYKADVLMQFDIPFVRIGELNGQVYFKQPNKFRVKTKGIAFLPKQDPYYALSLLQDSTRYIAVESGKQNYGTIPTRIIQLIPNDQTELVLAKFWIDPQNKLILRSQLTTKSSGTIQIDYQYGKLSHFGLPDKLLFTVETSKFKVPKAIAVDLNSKKKEGKDNKPSDTGKIQLVFSNYEINKYFGDEVFSNKK